MSAETPAAAPRKGDEGRAQIEKGIFRDGFTPEDLILYVFGFALLGVLAAFFWTLNGQMHRLIDEKLTGFKMTTANPAVVMMLENRFLEVQMDADALRYQYASAVLLSRSARTNAAFMIGATLALMGSFIIIREVRGSGCEGSGSVTNKGRVKVAVSSPGVSALVLGTIIILTTLVAREKTDINEQAIQLPFQVAVTRNTAVTNAAAAGQAAITDYTTSKPKESQ